MADLVEGQPYYRYREALRGILSLKPKAADLLIGIDGFSGAGKSTLSRTLAHLDKRAVIIQMDDFYRPMPEDEGLSLSPAQGFERYYDWQRVREQVLAPLSQSRREISYQSYDWPSRTLGRWERFQSSGVVVVEGTYSTRPELRDFYDYRIFVATPDDVRRARMAARKQNPSAWREKWLAVDAFYNEREQPRNFADLVIAGE